MSATWTPSHKHLTWAPFQTVTDAQREIEDLKLHGPFWLNDGDSLTRGDILRVNSSLEVETLAKAGTGKILRANSLDLTYSTFTLADTYAAGDLVYASAANTLSGLTVGSAGKILGISGSLPAWVTPSTYLAHTVLDATYHTDTLAGTVAFGDIIRGDYNGGTAKWKRLAAGTAGALLMTNAGADSLVTDPNWATTLTGNYTLSAAGTALSITNNLAIGDASTTIPISGSNLVARFVVHDEQATRPPLAVLQKHSATATSGARTVWARSRGTEAAPTVVANNDLIARLQLMGFGGSYYYEAAELRFNISDPTPSETSMGGQIEFATTAPGATTATLALTINNAQNCTFAGAGTAVTVTNNALISGSLTVSSALTLSAHTATRVFYAGTAGLVSTDAGFTFNASTDTFTLGTNHIYSQGAHGLTLAADDWAVGSASTNYARWVNATPQLLIAQNDATATPTIKLLTTTATGVPGIEFFRTGTFAFTIYAGVSGTGFVIADSSSAWPGTTIWQGKTTGQHFVSTQTDATSAGSLAGFAFQGAVIKLGDPITAATLTNGIGLKFVDQGTAHASIRYIASSRLLAFGDSSNSATSLAVQFRACEMFLSSTSEALTYVNIYGYANLGTTTLATAQGDIAAGKTGVFQWRYQQSTGTNFWYGSGGAVWAQLIAGTGMSIGTASAPSNSATLDVQGSLGVGAHGWTLANADVAFGSSTSSRWVYDDSTLTVLQYGTGAAVFNKFSGVAGTENVFNETGTTINSRFEGDTDANLLHVNATNDTVQIGAASASDSAKFYVSGKISMSGECEINGDLNHDGSSIGFFGTAPAAVQTVTGSRADPEGALKSLLSKLATYGLIVDSSSV